jgi:hypothetical protein
MNTAAIASYSAVPSLFMVAPRGSTKLEMCRGTPRPSSTQRIVTGSDAALELVVNATTNASKMPRNRVLGERPAMNQAIAGSTTTEWNSVPPITTAEKASRFSTTMRKPIVATRFPTSAKIPTGASRTNQPMIKSTADAAPARNSVTALARGPSCASASPSRIANATIGRMWPAASAATGFSTSWLAVSIRNTPRAGDLCRVRIGAAASRKNALFASSLATPAARRSPARDRRDREHHRKQIQADRA